MLLAVPFLIALISAPPMAVAAAWFIHRLEEKPESFSARAVLKRYRWILATLLATLAVTVLLYIRFELTLLFFASLVLGYGLLAMSLVDLRTFYLPDLLTKPLIALGILQGALGLFTTLEAALIGAAVGYGVPWLINATFRLIRKKDGMGGGDFKLLAALGAWGGWAVLPLTLFLASVAGLVFALITRVGRQEPFPFGPALAAAGLVCFCYGNQLLAWYLGLLGA